MIIKCLSVKLPYAAWIEDGTKRIEFRTWSTAYRGPLLIVASKNNLTGYKNCYRAGKSLCVVDLQDIRPIDAIDHARKVPGYPHEEWDKNWQSWLLGEVIPVNRIIIKGQLGIYEREVIDETIINAWNQITRSYR